VFGGNLMNILIGYGNSLCRDFVQNHLATTDDNVSIQTVGTVEDCMTIARDNMYLDMIGLDMDMPDMDGLLTLDRVRGALVRPIPIALIGPPANRRSIRNMLTARAAGYLTYSMGSEATLNAIKLIASGEIFVPVETFVTDEIMVGKSHLTGREQEVLEGLLGGNSNKEIARKLNLSEVTIKHHLKSLRSKLGARNRTHAVCRAIELGMGS
jgi:two-component system nitrate/nitrite response regulator NarL